MADHEAAQYYRALVGEEFTGTWVGYHDHGEPKSQLWVKVAISDESENMAKGLQAIKDIFKDRIWKGFDDDSLYIKTIDPVGVSRYKIKAYRHFVLPNDWRGAEKHEDGCGFYFILETVIAPETPEMES